MLDSMIKLHVQQRKPAFKEIFFSRNSLLKTLLTFLYQHNLTRDVHNEILRRANGLKQRIEGEKKDYNNRNNENSDNNIINNNYKNNNKRNKIINKSGNCDRNLAYLNQPRNRFSSGALDTAQDD